MLQVNGPCSSCWQLCRIKIRFIYDNQSFCRQSIRLFGYIVLCRVSSWNFVTAKFVIRLSRSNETAGDAGALEYCVCLPYIDCFVPSITEATSQTGIEDPKISLSTIGPWPGSWCKDGSSGTLLSPSTANTFRFQVIPPGPVTIRQVLETVVLVV